MTTLQSPPRLRHPLARVLAAVGPDCCPERVNFHCHTVCSDGSLEPEALARQALGIGLEHLAVTDHHSLAAHSRLEAVFAAGSADGQPRPTLWTGVEISCLLRRCLVHVLALGFQADAPSIRPYLQGDSVSGSLLQAAAVRDAVHEAGGLVVLAHPARYRLPFQPLLEEAASLGFDGAETWYDYEMQPHWQPTPLVCEAIDALAGELGLLRSGGTDSHGYSLRGR
ncbi:PHP domain-containing protein [Synechococcus sp. RSCCF101]|uniref:PHP domain-containing protein n=1 Tax=Synechococcus sp. RSCCF101 TaxID=2511069 RepID=UPI0012445C84|nr:PHP domain-containing protein [Synechococcus sp. RSCCF101]QEY31725.1 PHP domain-containing protein [Synechococcus sp. RSCCF101]